jgi:hypothetical protein
MTAKGRTKVDRLGEFSPIGRLYTWASFFLKMSAVAQICVLLFPMYQFWQIRFWQRFGRFVSQTHPVTLAVGRVCAAVMVCDGLGFWFGPAMDEMSVDDLDVLIHW